MKLRYQGKDIKFRSQGSQGLRLLDYAHRGYNFGNVRFNNSFAMEFQWLILMLIFLNLRII